MTRRAVRLEITGRVQGVWYRAWTEREARSRKLDGWVRNRRDGRVEAVLAGAADQVDAMIAACHVGPPAAKVERIAEFPADDPGPGFEVRATA